MIKKMHATDLDKRNLSLKKSFFSEELNKDYKKVIVKKPWGYEYLMFENKKVAIWILFLKKGHSTSMHCHPRKKTSLTVLSGQVIVSSLDAKFNLNELDVMMIDKKVFHSSEATSLKGALIMEIESPPNKADLVRLKDRYGREKQGYEKSCQTPINFDRFAYIDFHDGLRREDKFQHKILQKRNIRIQRSQSLTELTSYLNTLSTSVVCFLDANLKDNEDLTVLKIGDIITKSELDMLNINKLRVQDNFYTLIIH